MKKFPWSRYTTRITPKKGPIGIYFFSDDSIFVLRNPVIQKPFSPKKSIPLSESIVRGGYVSMQQQYM